MKDCLSLLDEKLSFLKIILFISFQIAQKILGGGGGGGGGGGVVGWCGLHSRFSLLFFFE